MSEIEHDPFELLRSAVASSSLPSLLDESSQPTTDVLAATTVSFTAHQPPVDFPVTIPTRLTSQVHDATNMLTLQQLLYLFLEKDTGNADYMRKAAAGVGKGFRPVGILDRRNVIEILEGGKGSGRLLVKGSRPEEARFEGEESGTAIPTSNDTQAPGTSVDQTQADPAPSAPLKRKYIVNEADKEFCRKILAAIEKPSIDIYDPLRHLPPGNKTDFSALQKSIAQERVKPLRAAVNRAKEGKPPLKDSQSQSNSGHASSAAINTSTQSGASRGSKRQKSIQQNIIMLSSSPTALISMWNVKRLLEDGEYERSDIAKSRQQAEGNLKMEDVVAIYRNVPQPTGEDKKVKYYAIDSVDALLKLAGQAAAWDRVLCVFTTGQAWQFKGYKWEDPKELFRNVTGVYFHHTTDPQHPAIKDWNVKVFKIDPKHRHTDRPVVSTFWQTLDRSRTR